MFIVLYQFKVKSNREQEFCQAWHAGTIGIYESRGSLGSRLHKSEDGTYIAYAQWPSAEQYEKNLELASDAKAALTTVQECCDSVAILQRMTVVDDLLKEQRAF